MSYKSSLAWCAGHRMFASLLCCGVIRNRSPGERHIVIAAMGLRCVVETVLPRISQNGAPFDYMRPLFLLFSFSVYFDRDIKHCPPR